MKDTWRDTFNLGYLGFCLLIFGVPIVFWLIIKWEPSIGLDSEGEPISLSFWLISFGYWICLFLIHKYKSERDELKRRYEPAQRKLV